MNEIKLNNNTRIRLEWLRDESLYVQFLRPNTNTDGHGLGVEATTILSGRALSEFLDALQLPPPREAA